MRGAPIAQSQEKNRIHDLKRWTSSANNALQEADDVDEQVFSIWIYPSLPTVSGAGQEKSKAPDREFSAKEIRETPEEGDEAPVDERAAST